MSLYYVNDTTQTELTSTALNSLTAGTYTLIAKYHDVEATGGTISLQLTEASNAVIVDFERLKNTNQEWDWAVCAQIIANNRLSREGSAASTATLSNILVAVYQDLHPTMSAIACRSNLERVEPAYTVMAADLFYTNNTNPMADAFQIQGSYTENHIYEMLSAGKLMIMYFASNTDTTSAFNGRYVIICGIDKVAQKYYVYDPFAQSEEPNECVWYSYSDLENGTILDRTDLSYNKSVIEFS